VKDETAERKKVFAAGMEALANAFDVPMKDARLKVYWSRLGRYNTVALEKALSQALDNETRFPSIADIRKYLEPLLDPRRPPTTYPILG
jgi:hypothetical protein